MESVAPASRHRAMMPALVSVIVPCHGSAHHLPNLLRSLSEQTFTQPWEVMLVDNRSADDLAAIARPFSDRLNLRIVAARDRANASFARNEGVRFASADWLLFVDADDEVDPG